MTEQYQPQPCLRLTLLHVTMEELMQHESKRSWKIYVQNAQTKIKSSSFVLEDPLYLEEYKDFQWYLEEYAASEPYASDRAERCIQVRNRYRQALFDAIMPHLANLVKRDGTTQINSILPVHLMIQGDGTATSLHCLFWELLEEYNRSPISIQVTRTIVVDLSIPQKIKYNRASSIFKILFVAARPGREHDISYCSISRQIVKTLRLAAQPDIQLDFCRPGTWLALKRKLTTLYDLVHFDMHGSIIKSKGQDTAILHFAAASKSSKAPDRKTAVMVAELLSTHGVQFVILNACNSATTGRSTTSNLAYTIASYGISHVVAMTYKVKVDAAMLAMTSMYTSLTVNSKNFSGAVQNARLDMRRQNMRAGRYGVQVACEDFFNLVHYSASDLTIDCMGSCTGHQQKQEIETSMGDLLDERVYEMTRTQDLDLLSLEDALEDMQIVFVGGESGTGKSTLAKHLKEWWSHTSFAETVYYCDSAEDGLNAISNSDERAQNRIPVSDESDTNPKRPLGQQLGQHNAIILLDNVETFDPWPQLPTERKGIAILQSIVQGISRGVSKAIIFTRLAQKKISADFPGILYLDVSLPSPSEALSLALSLIPGTRPDLTPMQAAHLEDVIGHHRMNLLFVTEYMPRWIQNSQTAMPYDYLPLALDHPTVWLLEIDRICKESTAFHAVGERFSTWEQQPGLLARGLILPFCMFQQRSPTSPYQWLAKVLEKGVLTEKNPIVEAMATETGKIWELKDSDFWERAPSHWPLIEAWTMFSDALISLGLWREANDDPDHEEITTWMIHPLLPYFLRAEHVCFRGTSQLNDTMLLLRQSFWEYFELHLDKHFRHFSHNESALGANFEANLDNAWEAIRLGTEHPVFPYHPSTCHTLVSRRLNFTVMSEPQIRRWIQLFREVLARYEHITSHNEWKTTDIGQKIPCEEYRVLILQNIMVVAEALCRASDALGESADVVATGTRSEKLLNSFSSFVERVTIESETTFYVIEIRKASHLKFSALDADQLNFLFTTLSSTIPDEHTSLSRAVAGLLRNQLIQKMIPFKHKIPAEHPLYDFLGKQLPGYQLITLNLATNRSHLLKPLPFSVRDVQVQLESDSRPQSNDDHSIQIKIAETSRRLQKSFKTLAPVSSQGYFIDTVYYAFDPDIFEQGEMYVFNQKRLLDIYNIALQIKFLNLEAFSLLQLGYGAVLKEDWEIAHIYLSRLAASATLISKAKDKTYFGPPQRQEEFVSLINKKLLEYNDWEIKTRKYN